LLIQKSFSRLVVLKKFWFVFWPLAPPRVLALKSESLMRESELERLWPPASLKTVLVLAPVPPKSFS
jgi:hypothetical protein